MKTGTSKIPLFQVDAFTNKPFKGNPAAVCILSENLDDSILQKIAAEMNLSETAFVYVEDIKRIKFQDTFKLRWFTPKLEVNLCGHATLASAAVLFFEYGLETDEIQFETLSGILSAKRIGQSIALNFPKNAPKDIDIPIELLSALGIRSASNAAYSEQVTDILIELENEDLVKNVKPNFEDLLKLEDLDFIIRGVMITAKASSNYDFVSRFFAPWAGINEDPVTGSAHTTLAPYWSKRLNKTEMLAYQISERGGEVKVKLRDDDRVEIIGDISIILRGELILQ